MPLFGAEVTHSHEEVLTRCSATIKQAQISAMKAGDKPRLGAVRLILAKVKDRDIERVPAGAEEDDATVIDVLAEDGQAAARSIELYETGGRDELAEVERGELAVIEEFLPAADGRSRDQGGDRGHQGRARRRGHEGHGPGDGRAEGAPRHRARHGPGERLGEGSASVKPPAPALAAAGGVLEIAGGAVAGAFRPGHAGRRAHTGRAAHFAVPDFADVMLGTKIKGSEFASDIRLRPA